MQVGDSKKRVGALAMQVDDSKKRVGALALQVGDSKSSVPQLHRINQMNSATIYMYSFESGGASKPPKHKDSGRAAAQMTVKDDLRYSSEPGGASDGHQSSPKHAGA